MEVGLALLAHSHLPNFFWEDAFLTAVYIINRLSSPMLQHKLPYEMVNNSKLDFNFYKFFDVLASPTYVRIINIKWIFNPKGVSLLAIELVIGGINA
jgi:hypothetical protein